jgi:HEAT repeat protein
LRVGRIRGPSRGALPPAPGAGEAGSSATGLRAECRPPARGTIVVVNPGAATDNEKRVTEFKQDDTQFAEVPNDDVSSLIRKLESGSEADELAAAQRLGEFGTKAKAAVEPLARVVGRQAPSRREVMLLNLGDAGTLTAGPVRIAAVKALYKIDRSAAVNALESATQCSHPGVRRWANGAPCVSGGALKL